MQQGPQLLQIQTCVMRQTKAEEFVKQILQKDNTVFNKSLEDIKELMNFSFENLIATLELLETKFEEEQDLDTKKIYEKFIIETKGIILSYGDNDVAKLLLKKENLDFYSIAHNFDSGQLKGKNANGEIIELDFNKITCKAIQEICKGVDTKLFGVEKLKIQIRNLNNAIIGFNNMGNVGIDNMAIHNEVIGLKQRLLYCITQIDDRLGQTDFGVLDDDMK